MSNVVKKVCEKFKIGSQGEGCFKYIGLQITQSSDKIVLDQNSYAATVTKIPITNLRAKYKQALASPKEKDALRSLIGQLNWISNHSRPDLSYDVLQLSNRLKDATVSDIIVANKVISKLQSRDCSLIFPRLENLKDANLVLFNDASYANLPDGFSSCGGRIMFLVGKDNKCCPVTWSSTKIKRVVKSSLSAEAMSLVDGIDAAYCVGSLISEVLFDETPNSIPIYGYIDNKSLMENIKSTTLVSEKRLRVDIAAIQQSVERGEVIVKWIPCSQQVSDCLTKAGASCSQLVDIIKQGVLHSIND